MRFLVVLFLGLSVNAELLAQWPCYFEATIVDTVPVFNKNILDIETLAFPYVPRSCGNGMAARLTEAEIAGFFRQAFAEEGMKLDSNHVWRSGEQAFRLDLYDEATGIGYAFVNFDELGANTRTMISTSANPLYYGNGISQWDQEVMITLPRGVLNDEWRNNRLTQIARSPAWKLGGDSLALITKVHQFADGVSTDTAAWENILFFDKVARNNTTALARLFVDYQGSNGQERVELERQIYRLELLNLLLPQSASRVPVYERLVKMTRDPTGDFLETDEWKLLAGVYDLAANSICYQDEDFSRKMEAAIRQFERGDYAGLRSILHFNNERLLAFSEAEAMTTGHGDRGGRIALISFISPLTIRRVRSMVGTPVPDSLTSHLPPMEDWKELDEMALRPIVEEYMAIRDDYSQLEFKRAEARYERWFVNQIRGWIRWAKRKGNRN